MYYKSVRDLQHPILIIVVSDAPSNFSAIASPSLREWTPARLVDKHTFCKLSLETEYDVEETSAILSSSLGILTVNIREDI